MCIGAANWTCSLLPLPPTIPFIYNAPHVPAPVSVLCCGDGDNTLLYAHLFMGCILTVAVVEKTKVFVCW